jgi:hypothetical protein
MSDNKKIKRFIGPNATKKIIEELLRKKLNEEIEYPDMKSLSPEEQKKIYRKMLKQKEKQIELKQLLKKDINDTTQKSVYIDKKKEVPRCDPVAAKCLIYSIFIQAKIDYAQEPKQRGEIEEYFESKKFLWHCELADFDPGYAKKKIREGLIDGYDLDNVIDIIKARLPVEEEDF